MYNGWIEPQTQTDERKRRLLYWKRDYVSNLEIIVQELEGSEACTCTPRDELVCPACGRLLYEQQELEELPY